MLDNDHLHQHHHSMISSSSPDYADYDNNDVCWNVNCALLPLGYLLLIVDSYFDIRWVLWPSPKTAQAVKHYYVSILTPLGFPYCYPGYWWPVYAIFKMCVQCPTFYNYILLALFGIVAHRYAGVLNGTDVLLRHWWTVIVVRLALAYIVTKNLQTLQCHSVANYTNHVRAFLWIEQ